MSKSLGAGMLVIAFLSSYCGETTRVRQMRSNSPRPVEANYVVGGQTTGTGATNYVFGIPSGEPGFGYSQGTLSSSGVGSGITAGKVALALLFPPYLLFVIGKSIASVFTFGKESDAVARAKFDALSKVQGATHFDTTSIYSVSNSGSVSSTETVTVTGRGITVTGPGKRTDY